MRGEDWRVFWAEARRPGGRWRGRLEVAGLMGAAFVTMTLLLAALAVALTQLGYLNN